MAVLFFGQSVRMSGFLVKQLAYSVALPFLRLLARRRQAIYGLCWHRFEALAGLDPVSGMAVTAEGFRQQLDALAEIGRFITLEEAACPTASGGIRFFISFDDGYLDNAEVLLPILEERNIPAAIFPTLDFVTGRIDRLDHDREHRHPIPALNAEKLMQLAGHPLITLGGHTVTHLSLARFDEALWEREVDGAIQGLRQLCGLETSAFAYTFGKQEDFDWEKGGRYLLRRGVRIMVSNYGGLNLPDCPDRIEAGGGILTHLTRVPMPSLYEKKLIQAWVLGLANRGAILKPRRMLQ